MFKHGTYTARVAELGKISCDQGRQRGEQVLNRRGFYENGLLSFLSREIRVFRFGVWVSSLEIANRLKWSTRD